MNYIILEDFEIQNLQKQVNVHMEQGYKPIGGLAAVPQKKASSNIFRL